MTPIASMNSPALIAAYLLASRRPPRETRGHQEWACSERRDPGSLHAFVDERYRQRENRAFSQLACDSDVAAEEAGELTADGKAEPQTDTRPGHAGSCLDPLKLLENQLKLVGRYAGARIGDDDVQLGSATRGLQFDPAAIG